MNTNNFFFIKTCPPKRLIKTLLKYSFYLFIGSLFLVSCASRDENYKPPLSGAIGKTNEIVVIADKSVWEGPVGDTLRYYFGSAYLILPQPEPMFDLRHFTINDLKDDRNRRQLRTYLAIGNLADETSQTTAMIKGDLGAEKVNRTKTDPKFHTVVAKNKWAIGQMITYIFGNTDEDLMRSIRESFPAISKKVHKFDEIQVNTNTYFRGRNIAVEKDVKAKLGVDIKIPKGYITAIEDENTFWLRYEEVETSSNIFIHKLPYVNKEQFTQDGIRSIRDSLGKKYVTTEVENAYMKTNDIDLPMFLQTMDLNSHYAVEARGIWDVKGDFMGGPFIGYLLLKEETNELIYVDGFVHAPSFSKRKYMQSLENILKSTKFESKEVAPVKE